MEDKILNVLDEQIDNFICPNQDDFRMDNRNDFWNAIKNLLDKGIIRKRNCEGLAYEF